MSAYTDMCCRFSSGQAASDSEQNWDHLLEQQQVFHGAEMCKWKDALTTSAKLIVQVTDCISQAYCAGD